MKSFGWLKNLRRRYFFQACRWCCESNRLLLPFVESWQEENFPVLLLENISRVDGISAANSALPNLKNDSIFAFTDSTLTLEVLSTIAHQVWKNPSKNTLLFSNSLFVFSSILLKNSSLSNGERKAGCFFHLCYYAQMCHFHVPFYAQLHASPRLASSSPPEEDSRVS